MNKKGFTIVELLASLTLTMLILVFLFQVVVQMKDIYKSDDTKTKILRQNAMIADELNTVLDEKNAVQEKQTNGQNYELITKKGGNINLSISQNTVSIKNIEANDPTKDKTYTYEGKIENVNVSSKTLDNDGRMLFYIDYTITKDDESYPFNYMYISKIKETTNITINNVVADIGGKKKKAYDDETSSEHVDSNSGIDFSAPSEKDNGDENGKGLYEMEDDGVPIYYFRGDVNDNNVIFAGFCWKILRTTKTGGVKMIYNGKASNGQCTNIGTDALAGRTPYNNNPNSLAYGGYQYNKAYEAAYDETSGNTKLYNFSDTYAFGNTFTYSGGKYHLNIRSTGKIEQSTSIDAYKYTCFNQTGECDKLRFIFKIDKDTQRVYYITLTDGKSKDDALNEMLTAPDVNTKNSTIKSYLDNWYNNNLQAYSSYLENTNFCVDRTIQNYGGYGDNNPIWGDSILVFSNNNKGSSMTRPKSLSCPNALDNYNLKVGLIDANEVNLAGGTTNQAYASWYTPCPANNTGALRCGHKYFLQTGRKSDEKYAPESWIAGPITMNRDYMNGRVLDENGNFTSSKSLNSPREFVRPVISLSKNVKFRDSETDNGSTSNPYIVETK